MCDEISVKKCLSGNILHVVNRVTATSELEGQKLYMMLVALSKLEWIKNGSVKNSVDHNYDCVGENKCVFDANETN